MNALNQTILECKVMEALIGKDKVMLTTETERNGKTKDGKVFTESIKCKVGCYGMIANILIEQNDNGRLLGRGLRLVARMANDEEGNVYLVAEHIEFKPYVPKKEK